MDIISHNHQKHELLNMENFSKLSAAEIKTLFIPMMNQIRFNNESEQQNQFAGFNDGMMVAYFLYRDKHVDSSRVLSEKTIKAYHSVIKQFLNDFATYSFALDFQLNPDTDSVEPSILKSLRPRHVEYYTTWLQSKDSPYPTYSAASMAQRVTILKNFLKKLYEWQYIKEPIYLAFKSVALTKRDKPNRDVTPKQVKFLLDTFIKMNHLQLFCITHFLVTTGIRNTEFCNLRVGDIMKDPMTEQYYMKVIAKGNKDREIPLLPKTMETIRIFRKRMGLLPLEEIQLIDVNAPLFPTSSGKAYSASYLDHYYARQMKRFPEEILESINKQFSYIERENPLDKNSPVVVKQVKITPHVFRHAFAIISHHSGVSLDTIKDSLGHNDRKTTEIYLESIIRKENNAVHQWDAELMGGYI